MTTTKKWNIKKNKSVDINNSVYTFPIPIKFSVMSKY